MGEFRGIYWLLSQLHAAILMAERLLKNTSDIVACGKVYWVPEKSWFVTSLVCWNALASKGIFSYVTAPVIVDFRYCKYVLYCIEVANNENW